MTRDVGCIAMTMVLMMRPAEMSAKMNVNMHAEEVRAEMNFDSGGDSEDERRHVACSGDYFTGSGDYILIRRV